MQLYNTFTVAFIAVAVARFGDAAPGYLNFSKSAVQKVEDISACMISPGFPIDRWYHPDLRPKENGTFADLAVEWYRKMNTSGNKTSKRATYDGFGAPTGDYHRMSTWPYNQQTGTTDIPYCFKDAYTEQAIGQKLLYAIQMFHSQMGPNPQHTVQFFEHSRAPTQPTIYCGTMFPNNVYQWNQHIHPMTLMVESVPGGASAFATCGFDWVCMSTPPTLMVHNLRVDASREWSDILHELMHVLGMMHEHQRPDASTWIKFNCRNVVDFQRKYQDLKDSAPLLYGSLSEDEFCRRYDLMITAGFYGSNFVPDVSVTGGRLVPGPYSAPYLDIHSIMMYDSSQGSSGFVVHPTQQIPTGIDPSKATLLYKSGNNEVPILRGLQPGINVQLPIPNDWLVLSPGSLSRLDKAWIRQTYPPGQPGAPIARLT